MAIQRFGPGNTPVVGPIRNAFIASQYLAAVAGELSQYWAFNQSVTRSLYITRLALAGPLNGEMVLGILTAGPAGTTILPTSKNIVWPLVTPSARVAYTQSAAWVANLSVRGNIWLPNASEYVEVIRSDDVMVVPPAFGLWIGTAVVNMASQMLMEWYEL